MNRTVSLAILAFSLVLVRPVLGAPKKRPAPPSKARALALRDEPRTIAEAYLRALEGKGDETARAYLLGGVTFTAQDARIPNWKIVDRRAPIVEEAFLAPAIKHMHDLDRAGAQALTTLLGSDAGATPDARTLESLLAPSREEIARFQREHPLFARVARVGKPVYWHPHNPWRLLVESIDQSGKYHLELHVFLIEEHGPKGKRTWPLRIVRFKTDHYDTGWKILPASSWDPDF